MFMNRLTIIGFLGQDAEQKLGRNGIQFTTLSIATKRSWKDAEGTWESRSVWHHPLAFGKLGVFAASLKKGAHVQLEGELRDRYYEVDGVAHRAYECVADSIVKMDRSEKTSLEAVP